MYDNEYILDDDLFFIDEEEVHEDVYVLQPEPCQS